MKKRKRKTGKTETKKTERAKRDMKPETKTKREAKKKPGTGTPPLTYVEIDLTAVRHNLRALRRLAGQNKFEIPTRRSARPRKKSAVVDVLTVIKADAYGHGMDHVAPLLDQEKVGLFGVSDIPEGIRLRTMGVRQPILLFEATLPSQASAIIRYRLTPSVCTYDLARALNEQATQQGRMVDIHVKVDTGMGRFGVWHEEAFAFIQKINRLSRLRITGLFTHFPAADTDKKFTRQQIQYLYDLVIRLDQSGLVIPYIHAANSMGLAGYTTKVLNLARPGLMLYGLYPHPSLKTRVTLKPAMSVRSQVIFLKDIPKGQSISYGRTFFTKKDTRIGVVPIGYNDGYFRVFSNKARVLINGVKCPVLGRVTMDQIVVDTAAVPRIKPGAPVTLLGTQKKSTLAADDLAAWAGTINYEIVCALGNRLPRVYR